MPFATLRAHSERDPRQATVASFAYPPDLLPRLQDTLSQLADIEFRYEARMDRLSTWRLAETARRRRLVSYLDARRKRERHDCKQRLSALEQRINSLIGITSQDHDF